MKICSERALWLALARNFRLSFLRRSTAHTYCGPELSYQAEELVAWSPAVSSSNLPTRYAVCFRETQQQPICGCPRKGMEFVIFQSLTGEFLKVWAKSWCLVYRSQRSIHAQGFSKVHGRRSVNFWFGWNEDTEYWVGDLAENRNPVVRRVWAKC